MIMPGAPQLSIVVVVLEGPERLQFCLDALARQLNPPEMEILVPWNSTHGDWSALQARFPRAQFLACGGRRTFAELRACGVGSARGAIVAITVAAAGCALAALAREDVQRIEALHLPDLIGAEKALAEGRHAEIHHGQLERSGAETTRRQPRSRSPNRHSGSVVRPM